MAEQQTDAPSPPPLLRATVLVLGAGFTLLSVLVLLLPDSFRLWNYAAYGAVALFVAARGGRLGLPVALVLALGGKLGYDLADYVRHDYEAQYLPMPLVYGCLAAYAPLGWALLRTSRNPLRVGGTIFLGSLAFFLVTNFASWVEQSLPYDRGPLGLLESYWMALPFWKGTLLSDFSFGGLLFGLDAALGRVPAGRPVPAAVHGDEP